MALMQIQDMESSTYLNSTTAQHDVVHLFECQWRCFGQVIFDECKTFVFVRNGVPWQADILDGAKRLECLFNRVFTDVETYTTDIHAAHTSTQRHLVLSVSPLIHVTTGWADSLKKSTVTATSIPIFHVKLNQPVPYKFSFSTCSAAERKWHTFLVMGKVPSVIQPPVLKHCQELITLNSNQKKITRCRSLFLEPPTADGRDLLYAGSRDITTN